MASGRLNFDPSRGTRRYDWANADAVAVGAVSARIGPIDAHEVMVSGSVPFHLCVGDVTVDADDGTHPVIAAGVPFHLQITSGEYIAVIRSGGSDGIVSLLVVQTD